MITISEKNYTPVYLYMGSAVNFCNQKIENDRTEEDLLKSLSKHTWFYENAVIVPLTDAYVKWVKEFFDGKDSAMAREQYIEELGTEGIEKLYLENQITSNIKLYGIRISIFMLERDINRNRFSFRLSAKSAGMLKETLEELTGKDTLLIPGVVMDPNAFLGEKDNLMQIGERYFNQNIRSFYTGLKESELLFHKMQEKYEFPPEVYRIIVRSMGYAPEGIGNEPIGIMEVVLPVIASKKPGHGIMDASELQHYMESPIIRDELITIPGHQELEADSVYSTIQYLIQSGIWPKEDRICAQIHVGTQLIPYDSYRLEMMEVAKKMFGITMVSDFKD